MRQVMLTTTDNPWDPFENFDDWYAWDTAHGYNTASYLARIAYSSPELEEIDQLFVKESAIDEILKLNITGTYKKLVREVPDVV